MKIRHYLCAGMVSVVAVVMLLPAPASAQLLRPVSLDGAAAGGLGTSLLGAPLLGTQTQAEAADLLTQAEVGEILTALAQLLGSQSPEALVRPLTELVGGLSGLSGLMGNLPVQPGDLGDLIAALSGEGFELMVGALNMAVDLIADGGDPGALTDTFGEAAQPLADLVADLQGQR